jgi:hypothetical protein
VPINVNCYVVEELGTSSTTPIVALVFEAEFGRTWRRCSRAAQAEHLVQLDDGSGPGPRGWRRSSTTRSPYVPARAGLGPRSADDLILTGGTTGMPKASWRAEDIFFAAMGGGNYGGPGIKTPAEITASVSAARA